MPRIGARLPTENDWSDTVDYAQFADQHGLESVWIAEGWDRNTVPLMTQIFEATDRIDVCAGIFNIYSRTPALMAMTARAFVDSYGERFRLGLGTSAKPIIEGVHGQSFESPLRRTREYIEIINSLLAGEATEYDGRFFDLSGIGLQEMEGSYDVPIYVAAMGETNLQLTGEFADGWLPLFVPRDQFEATVEKIEAGTQRGDRSIADVTKAPYVPTCLSADEPEESQNAVRDLIAWYIGGMGSYYHRTLSEFGYADNADAVRDEWQNGNHEAARDAVSDEVLDQLTLSGHPDEAKQKLAQYDEVGVDEFVAYIPPKAPEHLIEETIEHVANAAK